jgi:ribosomal protein S18 acetylase RimI-like enzyme
VLADGYTLRESPPPPADAVAIRQRAGLSPRSLEQTALALDGSWATAHVVYDRSGEVVGFGRVIGDGGWYFHIVDMAVLPAHQRRGIGDAVLTNLLDRIAATAPPSAYISLLADEPGRPLYRRHGFVETAPGSVGMVLRQ